MKSVSEIPVHNRVDVLLQIVLFVKTSIATTFHSIESRVEYPPGIPHRLKSRLITRILQELKYKGVVKCVNRRRWEYCGPKFKIVKRSYFVKKRLKDEHPKAYGIWKYTVSKCHKQSYPGYASFGGKGIEVCSRWKNSFYRFYADMGDPPDDAYLERKDRNKGFDLDNCFWSVRIVSSIEYRGKTQSLLRWCEDLGLSYAVMRTRLVVLGWEASTAFETETQPQYGYGQRILNPAKVREIRQLNKQGFSLRKLAKMYGVSDSTIFDVVKMRIWKKVK